MLGLRYFPPGEVKNRHQIIQSFLDEEDGSPIITSGRAKEMFLRWVKDQQAKILDVASGIGLFSSSLYETGFHNLYAADIDNYLRFPVLKEFKKVDFCFERLPWPDSFFDAVTSFETIEHLENPYHFIREVRRVLRSDGIFIMSTPNIQHIFNRLFFFRKGDMPRWRKNNNHLALFPRGLFAKAFLRYFDVLERGFFWGYFPYRWLARLKIFPENEWFAHTVYYVFRPRLNETHLS